MNTCLPNILWQKNQLRSFFCVFFFTPGYVSSPMSFLAKSIHSTRKQQHVDMGLSWRQIKPLFILKIIHVVLSLFKRVIFVNLKEKKLKGCSSFDRTYSVLQQQKYHLNWNQAVQKALKVHCYLIFYFKDSRETR